VASGHALWELMGLVLVGSTIRMSGDEACGCRWWLKGTTALVVTASWDMGSNNCWCGTGYAAYVANFWWLGLFAGLGLGEWDNRF
jgi:hypothetical protein